MSQQDSRRVETVPPILCPACGGAAWRTGQIVLETPDGPELDPPVTLYRCGRCRLEFREDGQPYDEAANREAWRERKEAPQ